MIQDIYPHKFYNSYDLRKVPSENDPVFVFRGDRVLVKKNGFSLPSVKDLHSADDLIYLFRIDGDSYYLKQLEFKEKALTENDIYREETDADHPVAVNDDMEFIRVQFLREEKSVEKWRYFATVCAFHLYQWYQGSRFCGRCGAPTVHSEKERCMICPKCGNHIYPKIVPAVIVGVTDPDANKLLVTRYAGRSIHYDALIAGFTEFGETLEENVVREVKEETGLAVTNIRYYKSQPWGMVSDILMGFYCDVTGSREVTLDGELGSAVWLSPDEIKGQPDDMSLTNEMMMVFKEKNGRV
ncbi:NAD(+) diphosphatase [Candidatus Weimeria sp. HCP3S3_B5]|uniref:NAD(+) diphosphatase n=1 Tax=Candidatus Weimeria sp. HCP3S3_B5 TaxID=3438871 RepID=UPI003F8C870C